MLSIFAAKLRPLRWDNPGLSKWALSTITGILIKERHPQKRKRSETWRRRQFEDGAKRDMTTSQGMPTATKNWNQQGMDSFLEPLEGAQPCWHFDFRLPGLWQNMFLFDTPQFVVIPYSSPRKLLSLLVFRESPTLNVVLLHARVHKSRHSPVLLSPQTRPPTSYPSTCPVA